MYYGGFGSDELVFIHSFINTVCYADVFESYALLAGVVKQR